VTRTALLLHLTAVSLLVACGGGGDGDGGGEASSTGCAVGGSASSATLEWDAVTAATFTGYRIYFGTASGAYLQPKGGGVLVAANETIHTLTGLSSGTTYYFAVTTYDLSNPLTESSFSNEACKIIS
jgi:hypothetical protein